MSSEINDPKKFRSVANILGSLESLKGPALQLTYIEKTLVALDNGQIVVAKEDEVKEKLYDTAIALYENADPVMRRNYSDRMGNILNSGKAFATKHNNTEGVKYFEEFLQVLPSKKKERVPEGLAAKVAIYAGLASSVVFFSSSSITGNVVLDVSNTVYSRSAVALGIGILVFAVSALISRKR
jgi:hypothetical protein